MKILIVDDSIVFRAQISNALNGIDGIELSGTASNGRIAIQKMQQSQIDLITLDMEMPELNGLETLQEMKRLNLKPKVIVFSSQTVRGAEIALDALREGADDVVAKPSGDELNFEMALSAIRQSLVPKILQFIDGRHRAPLPPETKPNEFEIPPVISPQTQSLSSKATSDKKNDYTLSRRPIETYRASALVIASSTGGPTALDYIFSHLKGPFKIPILIAQHMPPVFTQILAKRIQDACGVESREARLGEEIKSNAIYVAPGDYHLRVSQIEGLAVTQVDQGPLRNSVRPSADFLFESASDFWGSNCVGLVLTGMGEDGRDGALKIKSAAGGILIQNKASCTVFGMPGAVYESQAFDEVGDLDFIIEKLQRILT